MGTARAGVEREKGMSTSAQQLARQAKRLAVAFGVAFLFCVAAYTARSAVLRSMGRETRTAAMDIVNTSGLNVELLASMRSWLRHREVLLQDLVDESLARRAANLRGLESEGSFRSLMERDWSRFLATRTYPGERELQPEVSALLRQANGSADRALAALEAGDAPGAERIFDEQVQPTFDTLDERLKSLQAINGRVTASRSALIASIDRRVKRLSIVFDIACALTTVGAGVLALLLTREYFRAAVRLVSELELFSSRIAHDLRGPLGTTRLSVEMAARDPGASRATRDRLSRASRSLQSLADIVDGLLSLAGLMAGAGVRRGERASVLPVLEDVREELEPAAREKGVDLGAAQGTDCEVACSPGALASIARNLVGNAIKHMGDAPVRRVSMRVRSEEGRGWARIEVADSGPGIPRSLQPRVFEPFARLAPFKEEGLGLGLATVQRFAQLLGGRVGLESREGAGSTFWIELPRPAASSRAR